VQTYNIVEHSWFLPDGTLLDADCYSGAFPLGFNNPQMVAVKDIGPICPGMFTIGPLLQNHPKLGKNVMELIPDPDTQMYGRSGLFLHGKPLPPEDIRSGSDGCICAQESTRLAVNSSPDRRLQVV
jgi:hypothetical protein